MVVVGRPGYRIDYRTIKGGSQVSSLIQLIVESSNHCIIASSFLVLVWCFSLWVLDLMFILMTSSSSSKTEFTCLFYCVFGVVVFTGSCFVLLFVSFGDCGHLGDKLEFIENGVHSHLLWCFRCWSLCRFFSVGGFTPLFVGIPPLPLLFVSSLFWCYSSFSIQQAWVCSIWSSYAEVMTVLAS